jgi:acetylornithine/succinyldiaminopimelate/putrescine aminotransferase
LIIPTGLCHLAQGWPRSGLPWVTAHMDFNPERVAAAWTLGGGMQPIQGW